MRKLLVVLVTLFLVSPAWSKNIAGVEVAESISNPDGVTLTLNGAGIRKKLFFKIYVAALYLEKGVNDAQAVIGDPGAKRIVMHFIYDEVGKDKIIDGWKEGFAANVDAEKLEKLKPRLASFNTMFDQDMMEGDVITFDYLPGKGTQVKVKGEEKGTIEGEDFQQALLSVWLGKEPVSSDLRSDLLNK